MSEKEAPVSGDVLKPCPFGHAYEAKYPKAPVQRMPWSKGWADRFRVICQCGAEGPTASSTEEAITAWNTRATPPQPEASDVAEAIQNSITPLALRGHKPQQDSYSWTREIAQAALSAARPIIERETVERCAQACQPWLEPYAKTIAEHFRGFNERDLEVAQGTARGIQGAIRAIAGDRPNG